MTQVQRQFEQMIVRFQELSESLFERMCDVTTQAALLMRCLRAMQMMKEELEERSFSWAVYALNSMHGALDAAQPSSLTPQKLSSLIQELMYLKDKCRQKDISREEALSLDLRLISVYGFLRQSSNDPFVAQA